MTSLFVKWMAVVQHREEGSLNMLFINNSENMRRMTHWLLLGMLVTPNIIFCRCNIWMVPRMSKIFTVKILIFINFSLLKFANMMSLDEFGGGGGGNRSKLI